MDQPIGHQTIQPVMLNTPLSSAPPPASTRANLEADAAEFRTQGFTVLTNVLSANEVGEAKSALDQIFASEADIGVERGWYTRNLNVSYMMPQKHPLFRTLCFSPDVLALMALLLGESFVLGSLNGLSMTSGGENQRLHIDQTESVPGEILTINAMHVLDGFTLENGATRVVPGSQNRRWSWESNPADFESETVRVLAPAGSVVAFNGALWHAGSANLTDRPRRVLHAYFHKPWVVPQWDFSRSLTPDVIAELTPEQQRLFGFKSGAQIWDSVARRSLKR